MAQSWIDEYVNWIKPVSESPDVFHTWVALTVLSSAVKRNIWMSWGPGKLYSNIYTILTGPPAVGKGQAIAPCVDILRAADICNVMGDRQTMEYIMERMQKFQQRIGISVHGAKSKLSVPDNSVIIVSPELSVFMTASKLAVSALTDLYDAKEHPFVYGTRGGGTITINRPYLTLLGGSTPEFLLNSIPVDAIGGGFTRRVNFVFASKKSKSLPFPPIPSLDKKNDLIDGLRRLSIAYGEMKLADNAKDLFVKIHKSCETDESEFEDEATLVYRTSRWTNVLKVSMILSIAESEDLIIEHRHLDLANRLTLDVMKNVAGVFRMVGMSPQLAAGNKALKFIARRGLASRREIARYLYRDASGEQLDVILATFIDAGILHFVQHGKRFMYRVDKEWEDYYYPKESNT